VSASLISGGLAGAMAQTFSYPVDVTRRRMQLALMYPETNKFAHGMVSSLMLIYREDGVVRGLYRGLSINYLRAVPMAAISFATNEAFKQLFGVPARS
jgi:solute carrier family 25 protein 16